jgi:hypothetical protein
MDGSTRRIVSLILALTLSFVGLAGATWFLFFAPIYSFKVAAASGFVLAIGIIWLYSDFIDATPNERGG